MASRSTDVWVQDGTTGRRLYDAYLMGWVVRDDGVHAIVAMNDGEHPWFIHISEVTLKV